MKREKLLQRFAQFHSGGHLCVCPEVISKVPVYHDGGVPPSHFPLSEGRRLHCTISGLEGTRQEK